jgi:hypothetical protein
MMVDPLLFAALDEAALEGSDGCGVRQLWDKLQQRLPLGGVASLDAGVKSQLWSLLLPQNEDVTMMYGDQIVR